MPLRVYWEDLQPGMCVRDVANGMDYLVVDCNAEHEEEVISRSTLAGSNEWPGDTAVEDAALEKRSPAFATYVGLALHESAFDVDFTTPDEDSWGDLFPVLRSPMIGKATLICFAWIRAMTKSPVHCEAPRNSDTDSAEPHPRRQQRFRGMA